MSNKLKIKTKINLNDKLKNIKDFSVNVGYPKLNNETNSTNKDSGVTALEKATINNFGLGVPKRPFMFISWSKNKNKYKSLIYKTMGKLNKLNYVKFLNKLGILGVNDIQSTIVNITAPANSQKTIKSKGSSNPLIDTGHMRQSTTYSVQKISK